MSLLVVSVIIWALMALAPGDPAQRILRARGTQEGGKDRLLGHKAHHRGDTGHRGAAYSGERERDR